jgi:hypothetical protein
MPKYRIALWMGGDYAWLEARTMRQAWKYARHELRIARRLGDGYIASIMRTYDGDNAEYRAQPITRYIAA